MTAHPTTLPTRAKMLAVAVLTVLGLSLGLATPAHAASYTSYPFAQRAPLGAATAGYVTWGQVQAMDIWLQNVQIHDSDSDRRPAVLYTRILGTQGWESTGWVATARTTSRTWVNLGTVHRTSRVGPILSIFVKMCEDDGNPNTGYHCAGWQRFNDPYIQ